MILQHLNNISKINTYNYAHFITNKTNFFISEMLLKILETIKY